MFFYLFFKLVGALPKIKIKKKIDVPNGMLNSLPVQYNLEGVANQWYIPYS